MKNRGKISDQLVKKPPCRPHSICCRIIEWINHFQHVFWIICILISLLLFNFLMPEHIWVKIYTGIKAQWKLALLGFFFSLIALSLIWTLGQRIDEWIFRHLNSNARRPRWLNRIMLSFTQLGNFVFALLVMIILSFSGQRLLAYELILGVLSLGLVVQCLKVLIHRTRPYNKLKNMYVVGSRDSGHSFPSGHTSQAFFMVTLLLHYFQVHLFVWLALYALALFVGFTRIYVGMHFPRDVIAGAILGTAFGNIWIMINMYIMQYLNIS